MSNRPSADPGLSRQLAERIDRVCDRFEQDCLAGRPPRIEDYLQQHADDERPVLLRELLSVELWHRRNRGETPTTAEYLARFPQCSPQVEAAFRRDQPSDDDTGRSFDPHMLTVQTKPDNAADPSGVSTGPPTSELRQADSQSAGRTEEDGALPAGTCFGRYEVVRELGQGAFGTVYLAWDGELQRQAAVKVPHAAFLAGPEAIDRFQAEARILASLDHSHIVPAYDYGKTAAGRCFVVSKYVDGGSLEQVVKQRRPTLAEVVELVAPLAEALHHAHQRGLVHRDVKPANVLLDSAGRPLLADFGLALHEDEQRRRRDEISGSPAYMAPEQVRGEAHHLDGRADIWALGVILYELLTGRRPFAGPTHSELWEEILHREPKPPRQIDDTIPAALEQITLRCLRKPIAERFTTAADVAHELRTCMSADGRRQTEEESYGSAHPLAAVWDRLDPHLQDAFSLAFNQNRRAGKDRISTRDLFQALLRVGDATANRLFVSLPPDSLPEPLPEDEPAASTAPQTPAAAESDEAIRLLDAAIGGTRSQTPESRSETDNSPPCAESSDGEASAPSSLPMPAPRGIASPAPSQRADIIAQPPLLSDCVAEALQRIQRLQALPRPVGTADLFVDIAKHGHGPSVQRLREHGVGPAEIDQKVQELGLSLIWENDRPEGPPPQPDAPKGPHGWRWTVAGSVAMLLLLLLSWKAGFWPSSVTAPAPDDGPPTGIPAGRDELAPSEAAQANVPPSAVVDVTVWNDHDQTRRDISLRGQPGRGLPLRAGDRVRIEAQVERPQYLYLVWIDTAGVLQPVYPWKNFDWNQRPEHETPVRRLSLPEGLDQGWRIEGGGGREVLLLLARDEPLPPASTGEPLLVLGRHDLPTLAAALAPDSAEDGNDGKPAAADRGLSLKPGAIADPRLQMRLFLQQRLGDEFHSVNGLSFVKEGGNRP